MYTKSRGTWEIRRLIVKKKFRLFDMNKPGKGVKKPAIIKEERMDVGGFFRILKNRFWNISSLNMLYLIVNFPIIFALISLSGVFNIETTTPASPYFANLFGMAQYGETAYISSLLSVFGGNIRMSVGSTATTVFGYLSLLIIFTNGISGVGASYVLRGFVRSEPVFLFSDFFGAVKKNFRQGMILGLLDSLFLYVLAYGTFIYFFNSGTYAASVMLFAEILIFLIYLTMRFYMYLLLITFNLNIFKIIKNSFIFVVVGLKRNAIAWLGILAVLFVNFYLLVTIPMLGVVVPFLITVMLVMFISAFAAYPVIKKHMIDPYYKTESSEKITPAEEPIFIDRG